MSNEHRCDVTDVELESHRHQRGIANLDAAPDVFMKRFLLIRNRFHYSAPPLYRIML